MLDVERWAEIRRMHLIEGLSQREIARRTGRDRKTVRRALARSDPPRYSRPPTASKLDPFKDEVHRLLGEDPRLPATRVRELIAEAGFQGGQTIVDVYLREVRPLFLPRRTFQRTSYRPGELLQFDLFEPRRKIPVGYGQTRRGWVVVASLGYSRACAGTLVFSKEAPDILFGLGRCLSRLGGLPQKLVTDREGSLHAGGGRPTEPFAQFCGELGVSWLILDRRDCQAKGLVENRQRLMRSSFEPGRRFAGPLHFQAELDRWFDRRANGTVHRGIRCRPADRLAEQRAAMRALPEQLPDTDRRLATRVPADPHVRFDSCDYSLDPRLVGRRVEIRISPREVSARALDSGEEAGRHERSLARHRTITDPVHALALSELRQGRRRPQVEVERRPLARYDALIPA